MSKFTVSCLSSYFAVYLLKLKLILFHNKVVYYYTRIFLILHPHSVEYTEYTCAELQVPINKINVLGIALN